MRLLRIAAALFFSLGAVARAETIVFIRHAEKPRGGFGQLSCQGQNRALALPGYFAKAFPKIDAFFAPDPGFAKPDDGTDYDYVRPLATLEPTAVSRGKPLDAHIAYFDPDGLEAALQAPEFSSATVVVAWEHRLIPRIVGDLLTANGGDATTAPGWDDADFDSVYVVTLEANSPARFERQNEGLDGQSEACPQ